MDTQLYLVGLWTELPLNFTLKSIIHKEYTVVEIPSTFLTDSTTGGTHYHITVRMLIGQKATKIS